jgi:hypothetical protein
MDPQQCTTMAHKFQSVLDADVLNERGKQLGFSKRERLLTPFRFGLSVVASLATEQVGRTFQLGEGWHSSRNTVRFWNP